MAQWIERGNGDLAVKMGTVERYEGAGAPPFIVRRRDEWSGCLQGSVVSASLR
jgi:hypothetical protein